MSLYFHPCLCHTQDAPQLLCSHELESQKRVILDPTLESKHSLGRRAACFLGWSATVISTSFRAANADKVQLDGVKATEQFRPK